MRIHGIFLLTALPVCAQTAAVDTYLKSASAADFFSEAKRTARSTNTDEQQLSAIYRATLPLSNTKAFVDYVNTKTSLAERFPDATQLGADALAGQFNKLLGSSVGTSGTTSLTSGSAVSSILSLAMEYGAITQTNSGNVATIRTNLFALAQPLVGGEALPACTETSRSSPCKPVSRWLRKFSASYSAETSGTSTAAATGANSQTGALTTTNVFGGGYRTAGWSARMDWFAANPYAVAQADFKAAMEKIGNSPEIATLESSVKSLFSKDAVATLYRDWEKETITDLRNASSENDGKQRLAAHLDLLLLRLRKADSDFDTNTVKVQTAYKGYYDLLDQAIRDLQTNKFSTEFTAQHPLGQANTSNFRVIYSWQPTKTPLLFTFNGAVTWYDSIPVDVNTARVGRIRDAQLSGQVDRKIHNLGSIPNSVLTIAGYYQWQIENALITFSSGNTVPGTSIPLSGPAATLLAPKGNIAIAQLKWTLPIKNGVVKIPFSFTWANRTELINENEKRGQIGLTLDLDSVFAKGPQ
jgi:hypothetical protein